MTTDRPEANGFSGLRDDLLAAMGEGCVRAWPEERFETLALRVFRHQFETNPVFRGFCEGRGATPDALTSWADVPPVPVAAFKAVDLACGPPAEAEVVFRTSGTTRGSTRRGTHYVPDVSLYRASLLPTFRTYLLPDVGRLRFVSLIPSPDEAPHSSLSFMVGAAAEEHATDLRWVVDGEGAIDAAGLDAALTEARELDAPVLLLGTAFAFVHALEHEGPGLGELPEGSRIMETGGFKGRAREIPKEELYARLVRRTGTPRHRIVNEYGMTELLSQLYEPVLEEGAKGVGRHRPPPWLRARALDPVTLAPLPEGEEGLLAFFDLANAGSVCHVLTEDVGSVADGDVRLVGRVAGAEPRGCSRAMDELMSVGR